MLGKLTKKLPDLPRELRIRLRRAADLTGMDESFIVNCAIDEYLSPIEDDFVAHGRIMPHQRLLPEWPGV
jgi:predicted DNA-binding protein